MAGPKVINYLGGEKFYNREYVDKLLSKKQTSTVGEIMFWPFFEIEEHELVSRDTFSFKDEKGNLRSYTVPEDKRKKTVNLVIAKDPPDGWHALNGKAELLAKDYEELKNFFGEMNTTVDGRIWLPYMQQYIIRVKN